MRWLITNRNIDGNGFGCDQVPLTYWTRPDGSGDITARDTWHQQTPAAFQKDLVRTANAFPDPVKLQLDLPEQKHLSLFIHGYNNGWAQSVTRYNHLCTTLFDGPEGVGELISFDWPSKSSFLGYLPDQAEARQSADDLTDVLSALYDWLSHKQADAARHPDNACRARTSVLAHSMGAYTLQYAMNALWTRKNRPLLVSLLQEVLLIAADVDNDLFRDGERVGHAAGEGLANLSYRITALYTGRDNLLGAAAGLKHFGKRRLGRSGLDRTYPLPDNVWDIDCSQLLSPNVNGLTIHGEYFDPAERRAYALMRAILHGTDRSVLLHNQTAPAALPHIQPIVTASA